MNAPSIQYVLSDSSVLLMSPWKPLLMWGGFIAWGWLVSTKLDKDARYFNLNWKGWNATHLTAGFLAIIIMFTAWSFWISFPAALLVLLLPVLVYWRVRNQAVPEERRYSLSFSKDAQATHAKKQAKARQAAVIQFTDVRRKAVPVPGKDEPEFQVYLQAEDVLGPAIEERASRIDMLLGDSGAAIWRTIDGIRTKHGELTTEACGHVLNFFKQIAGLDVSNTRRRQAGSFSMSAPTGDRDVHLTTSGSSKGQTACIEFNREEQRKINYELLGLLPQQREGLDRLMDSHDRHGIVLITAPPRQGLTTTGYGFLGRHDAYTCNIKTLEYEIEAWIDGVDQVEWDKTNPDVDYATNLQSILRRDPDISLASDIRDADIARVAAAPGRQGPLVYLTMQSDSVINAVKEWVKYIGDVDEAVKPLRAVLNQRLIRKLCSNCKQAAAPEELESLKLPAAIGSDIHLPVGKVRIKNKVEDCPACTGTGYLGQTGVFEVFFIDKEIRAHLRGGDLKSAMSQARRNRMLLPQEAGLLKVGMGETSLDEISRVFSSTPKKKKKKKKSNSASQKEEGASA